MRVTGGQALTDQLLRAAPPASPGQRVELIDAACPGLRVRIDERGRKVFSILRVIGAGPDKGKRVRVTLRPAYPALSLAKARAQAVQLLAQLGAGSDPNAEAKASKRAAGNTLAQQWALFDQVHVQRLRPRSGKEVERPFRTTFLPAWRDRDVTTITRADVADVLDRMQLKRGLVPRNRAQAALSTFFAWLVDRGRVDASPVAGMKRARGEAPRDRVLSDAELRAFWWATDTTRPKSDEPGAPPAAHPVLAPLLRVLLLTGQRLGEVAGMRWDELHDTDEGKVWRIPADRYKTRRTHEVPLSDAVAAIIDARPRLSMIERIDDDERIGPSPFVFTTRGDAPFSGEGKLKPQVDVAMLHALRQASSDPKLTRWVIHDLRRTARTLLQRAGVPYDVGEAVLGHVIGGGGVGAVYARHGFADEKRAALERLAETVAAIVSPLTGNVTALAARRAARGK